MYKIKTTEKKLDDKLHKHYLKHISVRFSKD